MKIARTAALCLPLISLPALAQALEQAGESLSATADRSPWSLRDSDRVFLIATQADTLPAMSFRVGTVDQLQAVQGLGLGDGFDADVFADFAPLSWLQVGLTINYGTLGDPSTQDVVAPTAYIKAQLLRAETSGVNLAAEVQYKKYGFGRPTDLHANDGEFEGMILLDRRFGRVASTFNAVFGKSTNVPDSDAEVKLGAGYYVLNNVLCGVDVLGRYDTSFDGGPKDGTRNWELTGGPMVTWKLDAVTLGVLAGVAAPMHAPTLATRSNGIGPTALAQASYGF